MIGSPGKLVTDGRTDGSEFIGPTSKVGGSKKSKKCPPETKIIESAISW